MTLHVVAHFKVHPESLKEAHAALLEVVAPTRREAGCIRYQLLQNEADPTDFTFTEEWTDSAALEAHLGSDHIAAVRAKVAAHLTAPSDVRRYSLLG